MDRRSAVKRLSLGATGFGLFGLSGLADRIGLGKSNEVGATFASYNAMPKRFVFFLQNQGFHPDTCIPKGLREGCSLTEFALPKPISVLEPYKDKMNIITGLHGLHTSPSHSAYFGALGGYRGGIGVQPSGATVDHLVSQSLPKTILPHLRIGMDSLSSMSARPTLATLSASGPGQPLFMYSNPSDLHDLLFGGLASGDDAKRHKARKDIFNGIESVVRGGAKGIPNHETARYQEFTEAVRDVNELRERLAGASRQLRKFAPKKDGRYLTPRFETDWHDAMLEIGIAALKSNLTNVLTIGSGRGEIFGSWSGLGVDKQGHSLGHMKQPENPIWIKIRQYNCQMLVRIIEELESVAEGNGTMMDNTLIVYTSNNADKQHTRGSNWPFLLIGNCAGRLKTGNYLRFGNDRPINDLYTTFLRLAGSRVDRLNMDAGMAAKYGSVLGPIEELLA